MLTSNGLRGSVTEGTYLARRVFHPALPVPESSVEELADKLLTTASFEKSRDQPRCPMSPATNGSAIVSRRSTIYSRSIVMCRVGGVELQKFESLDRLEGYKL